ncbi:MAG TPA: hypothetical protein VHF06_38570, partial [Pseudonocardiaceae bacterium]|nr:hypothetical protein [Pseudonocardiaceae bacterium]
MTMAEEGGNPLVATVDTGSWTGSANTESLTYQEGSKKGQFSTDALSKDTEGAGLFSDAASTIGDISSHNWGGVAVDAIGDGMDALGMAMDPLGSLAGAGIGWLIEHVGFLKKPLDYLAGDPESVTAKAQTWTNVSKALSEAADQYKSSAQTLAGANTSDAVSGASATGENLAKVLDGASQHASDAASAMKVAAVAVGTTRGIIRDTISQFAGDAIVKWIAATAAAFFTFGATEAAFIVDEVAEGASVATQDASKVSKLVQMLEKFKGGAKDSESTLKNAASDLDKGAKDTDSLVHDASDAGGVHTDAPPKADADAGGGATTPSDAGGAPSVEEPPKADAGAGGDATTPSDAGGTPSTEAPPEADAGAGGGSTTPSDASGGTPTTEEPPSVDGGSDVTTPSESSSGSGSGGEGGEGGGSGSGEGGSGGGGDGTKPQHYWQKEEEGPSHEEVNQHVADHKQAVDSHNQEVAAHNQKADQFKRDAAEHNQKAVDNQQAL